MAHEFLRKGENLPTFDDFVGGSMALVGLQDTYQLNLTEVIHGRIETGSRELRSPYELSGTIGQKHVTFSLHLNIRRISDRE